MPTYVGAPFSEEPAVGASKESEPRVHLPLDCQETCGLWKETVTPMSSEERPLLLLTAQVFGSPIFVDDRLRHCRDCGPMLVSRRIMFLCLKLAVTPQLS